MHCIYLAKSMMYKQINVNEFKQKYLQDPSSLEIIDVREQDEFNQIRIKGSKLIPMWELESKLNDIDWTKQVVFVCRTVSRSGYITQVLNEAGYDAVNLAWWVMILRMNCEECMQTWNLDSSYFQ